MAEDDNDGGLGGDKKDTPAQKKQVKNEHVLIIVGVITLVVMVLYMRKSAAANASNTAASPYGVNSNPYEYGDPNYANDMDTLSSDLQSMQSEIAGLQADSGNGSSATYSAPAGDVLHGAGYSVAGSSAPIVGRDSNTYAPIMNLQQLEAITGAGQPVYFQPQAGQFVPLAKGQSIAGTPVYSQV